mgnify:CR=1 FL=1
MRRSSILWLVVVLGVAGALAIRVARQSIEERLASAPATRLAVVPTDTRPAVHDYVAAPQVDPGERESGPRRIVSMAPSLTETCCALGLLDRLVGRTQYCVNPPAVRAVAVVGGLVDPNLELLVSLKPDVILITKNSARLREQLTALKLPFEEVTDDSFEGIFLGIRRIGEIAGRPKTAALLIERLQDEMALITADAQTRHARRVLIVEGALPVPPASLFVAGPGLFLTKLLYRTGHLNAAESAVDRKSGELSLEQIVTINPDVILETRAKATPETMAEVYRAWSALGPIAAIRDRAVRSFGTDADLVPSPRINVVYAQMARALAEWR